MYQYVYDNLSDHLDKYSVNELITEVEDYYPELLEQDNDFTSESEQNYLQIRAFLVKNQLKMPL